MTGDSLITATASDRNFRKCENVKLLTSPTSNNMSKRQLTYCFKIDEQSAERKTKLVDADEPCV